MDKKKTPLRLGIGATSIFMIFVILVMCILSVLSYLRANSYYESAKRQVDITATYYQTEARLLEKYYLMENEDLQTSIQKYNILKENDHYILEENIDESQKLQLFFTYESHQYQIIGLKTVNMEEE